MAGPGAPGAGFRVSQGAAQLGRHYAMNLLDGNAIIGPWVGGLENFIVAVGFSGAGLQKGPAVGRALTELLLHGEYQSIDLHRLFYQRILDNKPLLEVGFKA